LGAALLMTLFSVPGLFVLPAGFARGFVAGGVCVASFALLANWVVNVTGTAPTMMGDQGEQWTASELRKLRRAGWRVVNHVLLKTYDIDHVLVGPGGAYAIETKWSARRWEFDPLDPKIQDATDQARRNARDLQLWHPFKSRGVQVLPVVVLWGTGLGARQDLSSVARLDGTPVVVGPRFSNWAVSLPSAGLSAETVQELYVAIEGQVAVRDARAAAVPPSLQRMAVHAGLVLLAAVASLVVTLDVIRWVHIMWLWPLLGLGVGALGVVARRVRGLRFVALGWFGGVAAGSLFIAIAVVRHLR
jgi:hypothetical protein